MTNKNEDEDTEADKRKLEAMTEKMKDNEVEA